MACVDAAIEALSDTNRALVSLGSRMAAQEQVGGELLDMRNHWADWRFEWEAKLTRNEVQFLRLSDFEVTTLGTVYKFPPPGNTPVSSQTFTAVTP